MYFYLNKLKLQWEPGGLQRLREVGKKSKSTSFIVRRACLIARISLAWLISFI